MKKLIISLVIILAFTVNVNTLFANPSPWTKAITYGGKTGGKFLYGFKNTVFGWTSIFMEPCVAIDKGDSAWGGFGKGFLYTFVYTLGGALQFLTFPAPFDIPLPEGGEKF